MLKASYWHAVPSSSSIPRKRCEFRFCIQLLQAEISSEFNTPPSVESRLIYFLYFFQWNSAYNWLSSIDRFTQSGHTSRLEARRRMHGFAINQKRRIGYFVPERCRNIGGSIGKNVYSKNALSCWLRIILVFKCFDCLINKNKSRRLLSHLLFIGARRIDVETLDDLLALSTIITIAAQ